VDPEFAVYIPTNDGGMTISQKGIFGEKNTELDIREIIIKDNEHWGKLAGDDGLYLRLVSSKQKVFWERISKGWNDNPEYITIPEVKTQMMLVTDMVLLWDEAFRKHLEVYAEDEDALRKDFGDAFKRLTENGFMHFPEPVFFHDSPSLIIV